MAASKRGSGKAGTATAQRSTSPEGFREPFNTDSVPWKRLPGSTSFKRLGAYGGGTRVGVGVDVLKPGQYSNRFHYHLKEEEHVFILKGQGDLDSWQAPVRDERTRLLLLPGGAAGRSSPAESHEAQLVFMTIGDNHPDDVVVFPNSGKARIRATGKMVPIAAV